MRSEFNHALIKFRDDNKVKTKGSLAAVLTLTRLFSRDSLPVRTESYITENAGQVRGLGGDVLRGILEEYGIKNKLAAEGGRTSRGTMGLMMAYVDLVNRFHPTIDEFSELEQWWIDRVKDFFLAKPYKIDSDGSLSVKAMLSKLIELASKKQKDNPGTMYVGALYQHLVAAKLLMVLGDDAFEVNGYSVNDESTARSGDFTIGDSAIHVTTAPTEALINKCHDNIMCGLKPIIITGHKGCEAARYIAEQRGIDKSLEVIELDQFMASNLYEWTRFKSGERRQKVSELVHKYNVIIDGHEGDPSMKIEIG